MSQQDSTPSSQQSEKEKKLELLKKYQDKSVELLNIIRKEFPEWSFMDMHNSCLIILGTMSVMPKLKQTYTAILKDLITLEYMEQNGLLPEQKKSEDSSPLS